MGHGRHCSLPFAGDPAAWTGEDGGASEAIDRLYARFLKLGILPSEVDAEPDAHRLMRILAKVED